MPQARLEVGRTAQAALTTFDQNRSLILRLTLVVSLLSAISALLDIAGPAGVAISFGILCLLGVTYGGMITALICVPGKSDGVGELWGVVKPVLARLVWVTLATALAALAGFIAFVIPCFVVVTFWAVAAQTIVTERTTVIESFGRSFELVKGNAWRVFGYILILALASLLLLALSLLIAIPLGTSPLGRLIGSFVSNALTLPVAAVGAAVLYRELVGVERARAQDDQGTVTPP